MPPNAVTYSKTVKVEVCMYLMFEVRYATKNKEHKNSLNYKLSLYTEYNLNTP